ncbi:unnamed protein product, partial [Musa textilis]
FFTSSPVFAFDEFRFCCTHLSGRGDVLRTKGAQAGPVQEKEQFKGDIGSITKFQLQGDSI